MPEHHPAQLIDAHQHLWIRSERHYDWILPRHGVLYDDFGPEALAYDLTRVGVTGTVLVQAADTYEDTFYMLDAARRTPVVRGVVGWVPLDRPGEARQALQLYSHEPLVRGIRNLTHTYTDPAWILGREVSETVSWLTGFGFTLDYVSTNAEHLALLPELARRHPDLTIVVDHLASPDIAAGNWEPWASGVKTLSAEPNVVMKLSGLATCSTPDWTSGDWQPYVDHVVSAFGSARVMAGGDWPVMLLAGDYVAVWRAQREVISRLSLDEQDDILFRTATRTYGLA